MMGTIHEDAVKHNLNKYLNGKDGTAWQTLLFNTLKDMGNERWWYLDAAGQNYRDEYTIYDAYAFALINCDIAMGKIAMCQIYVGDGPCSDNSIEDNNRLLSNIPTPFGAQFVPQTGGGANDDGVLWWDMSIKMKLASMSNDGKLITAKPKAIALEVGYTRFSKTLIHCRTYGVARWPYHHPWITVFYRLPKYVNDHIPKLEYKTSYHHKDTQL